MWLKTKFIRTVLESKPYIFIALFVPKRGIGLYYDYTPDAMGVNLLPLLYQTSFQT